MARTEKITPDVVKQLSLRAKYTMLRITPVTEKTEPHQLKIMINVKNN